MTIGFIKSIEPVKSIGDDEPDAPPVLGDLSLTNSTFAYDSDSADVIARIIGRQSGTYITVEPGILTASGNITVVETPDVGLPHETILAVTVTPQFAISDLGADLLASWLANVHASMGSPAGGGAIALWDDQVSSRDMAATGTGQPTYRANGMNRKPCVEFDGTTDFMSTAASIPASMSGANPTEVWLLVDQSTLAVVTGTSRLIAYGANNTTGSRSIQREVVSGINRARAASGDGVSAHTIDELTTDFTGLRLVRLIVTATETKMEIDGVMSGSVASVPSTGTTRGRLGTSTTTTPTSFWAGKVAKALITRLGNSGTFTQAKVDALKSVLLREITPVFGFHGYGSSSAGDGGNALPISRLLKPIYTDRVFQYTSGGSKIASSAVAVEDLEDLEPAHDEEGDAPYPMFSFATAFENLYRASGKPAPFIITRSDYYPSKDVQRFRKDAAGITDPDTGNPYGNANPYQNLIASITAGASLASANFGCSYRPVVFLVMNNGDNDRTIFAEHLTHIITSLRTDVAAISNVIDPIFMILQVGSEDTSSSVHAEIANGQNDVAEDFEGTNVAMAAAIYDIKRAPDNAHNSALGTLILGERCALAVLAMLKARRWTPPTLSVNRVGRVITLTSTLPLSISSDLPSVPNLGITYGESGNDNDIESVVQTSPTTIDVTLTDDPSGPTAGRLRYGQIASDSLDDDFQSARGLLYVDSGVASPYANAYGGPSNIRHPVKRFDFSF